MVRRCGRSLSLILTVLTLWPTSVEGQRQQPIQIESQAASHLAVCLPIERTQPARHPLAADVTTVGRADVRLAVGVITRYLTEQAIFWIRSLIAGQSDAEE